MLANIGRVRVGWLAAATAVVLAPLLLPSTPAAASDRYRAVDLGFGGEARAVNRHGQIVGEGSVSPDGTHGFLWTAGKVTDLGVLQHGEREYGRATAVNDRGQVAGFSVYHGDPEESLAHAFLWQHGVLTDIDPTSVDSYATAINNHGQVVGTRYTADGAHAFLWQAGHLTNLGTGYAWDINDRGQVIGQNRIGGTGATMWYHGRAYDLGAPPGYDDWRPIAINERGWIAGHAGVSPNRAYLWRSGTFLDLGTLGGPGAFVLDLNDRGQVLGLSDTASGETHPFLWENGHMTDLTTRGIPGDVTVDRLGEHGEIVGTTGDPFDQHAGYYLYRE